MAKSQPRGGINPPGVEDRLDLVDYSAVIQLTFDDLYQSAHDHKVLTVDPSPNDGAIQTISIVDNGTDVYMVVKTRRGWFKSPSFTAV